ncbi:MAG: hypothetical protein ACE5LF_07405 [Alphaproteobacteria bacterium]
MTIICAYPDRKARVSWIGCNLGVTYGSTAHESDPFWHRLGPWWIAQSSEPRAETVMAGMRTELAACKTILELTTSLRQAIRDDGFKAKDEYGAPVLGATFLIAQPGRLWEIDSAFHLTEERGFWAIGSGREVAFGAAHALHPAQPKNVVSKALDAAIHHDVWSPGKPWKRELKAEAKGK